LSLRHRNYQEYAADIGTKLNQFLEQQRDRVFEAVLWDAIMLFAFTLQDVEAKAKRHVPILQKVGIMLVALNDTLRGILIAQAKLCPMALATLARVAVEVRANLTFIATSEDPALYADRYERYAQVEKLNHDQRRSNLQLSTAEGEDVAARCAQWIKGKDPDGHFKLLLTWTADPRFKKLRQIAVAVGMQDDYDKLYDVTSKYVHGSRLMVHGYTWPDGYRALGEPKRCKQMASLACLSCMRALRTACAFFQVPLDPDSYGSWLERFLQVCEDINSNPPD
jgi:uncharacterized protein DUF5677